MRLYCISKPLWADNSGADQTARMLRPISVSVVHIKTIGSLTWLLGNFHDFFALC